MFIIFDFTFDFFSLSLCFTSLPRESMKGIKVSLVSVGGQHCRQESLLVPVQLELQYPSLSSAHPNGSAFWSGNDVLLNSIFTTVLYLCTSVCSCSTSKWYTRMGASPYLRSTAVRCLDCRLCQRTLSDVVPPQL